MPHRILIVDDHAIVRRMLKALVETHEGWQVCCEAENGEEAIGKVLEFKPDLVVMDMAMPVRDGISASRQIAAVAPNTPIVMHTLHYSPELALEAKKAGIRAVVAKADSSDDLLKTLEEVLSVHDATAIQLQENPGPSGGAEESKKTASSGKE